jgi:hypothetical protein
MPTTSSVADRENPSSVVLIIRVVVPLPLSVKLDIAAGSTNCPFIKNVKLVADVAGNGDGAVKKPLGKVAVLVVMLPLH